MSRTEHRVDQQTIVELPAIGWNARPHDGDGTVSVLQGDDCFQLLDERGTPTWTFWRRER